MLLAEAIKRGISQAAHPVPDTPNSSNIIQLIGHHLGRHTLGSHAHCAMKEVVPVADLIKGDTLIHILIHSYPFLPYIKGMPLVVRLSIHHII